MRTLVIGDVHGAARALEQVLARANYDPAGDHVIFLGDVADGWHETPRCLDIFAEMPNLTMLRGNHDDWFLDWLSPVMSFGDYMNWDAQGGAATQAAYGNSKSAVPQKHVELLKGAEYVHVQDGMVFVHGGWPWKGWQDPRDVDDPYLLTWDRTLWITAYKTRDESEPLTRWKRVFVGHTTTQSIGSVLPVKAREVWNLDQGAGYSGRLTLMDAETEEYWQSEETVNLYPGMRGR